MELGMYVLEKLVYIYLSKAYFPLLTQMDTKLVLTSTMKICNYQHPVSLMPPSPPHLEAKTQKN